VKIRGDKGSSYSIEIKKGRTRLELSSSSEIYKFRKVNRNESARLYRLRNKETAGSIRGDNRNGGMAEAYEKIY
jgi:hypothetical protein